MDQDQENDLNELQREGIIRYQLTRAQVTRANFGQHTLNGIQTLQRQDAVLTNQEAFNMISGMNRAQINGITQYNLRRDQVESPNFGNHTLNGMLNLRFQGVPFDQGFERVRGLENEAQVNGVTEYNLTRDDVQAENFGQHTLTGIDAIRAVNQAINNNQAFAALSGLNQAQVLGLTDYQLTRNQVHTRNFGMHTLMALDNLTGRNQMLTNPEAFTMVRELNPQQALGVGEFGLTREQVTGSANFGNHTLDTMRTLVALQRFENIQQAFQEVQGLNNRQTTGIRRGLSRQDVTTPNFDIHTLYGIEHLQTQAARNGNDNLSYNDAFQTVRELNAVQVRGITDLQLNREQVLNPRFGNDTIRTINRLKMINPEATNQYLYEAAMGLPEYQVRGLTKLGLSEEQVGLKVENNEFVQLPPDNQNMAIGRTIDAIDHLVSTEYMSAQQAFEIAINLDTNQVIAMTDFGLSLEQVQHSYFSETANVLNDLAIPVTRSGSELEFPLSEEEKQSLKDEISRSGSIQSLSQLNQESSQQQEHEQLSSGASSSAEQPFIPYAAAASRPVEANEESGIDISALTRAISLNSITERSIESESSHPSDEERKPAPKKTGDSKQRARRNRKL